MLVSLEPAIVAGHLLLELVEETVPGLEFVRFRAHYRAALAPTATAPRPSSVLDCLKLLPLRGFRLMEEHPGCAELIPKHREAIRERGRFHLHEDLAALCKQGVYALGVNLTVQSER